MLLIDVNHFLKFLKEMLKELDEFSNRFNLIVFALNNANKLILLLLNFLTSKLFNFLTFSGFDQ